MNHLHLGIIREGKMPADSRVPFTPLQCRTLSDQYPQLRISVAPSDVRCFSDDEYRACGIELTADLSNCDVLMGVKEVLDVLEIPELSPAEYLRNEALPYAVYTQLRSSDLYRREKDGNLDYYDRLDFHHHPELYRCDFEAYTRITDLMLNGVFWHPQAPRFFSKADMRRPDFRIRAIADISCDINGSIPATTRATTIGDAVMGYNPHTEQEEAPYQAHTIDIMSVDNLPNELPRDASDMFGSALSQWVVPELFKPESPLLQRATICKNGVLCPRFAYLSHFLAGK